MLPISLLRCVVLGNFLLMLCSSCQPTAEKTDRQTNMFVNRYNAIFEQYGKKPADSLLREIQLFVSDYPFDAKSWVLQGRLFFDLNKMDSSLACYRKAVQLDPQIPGGYCSLACMFSLSGEVDSANVCFQKAFLSGDTSNFTRLSHILLQYKSQAFLDSTFFLTIQEIKADSTPAYFLRKAYFFHQLKDNKRRDEAYLAARFVGFTDTLVYHTLIADSISLEEFCRLTHL
jgi:tetratricopeptide (TPR) repeat protein